MISDSFIGKITSGKNSNLNITPQKYFTNIISKISGTKCPIIIITNNKEIVKYAPKNPLNKKFDVIHTMEKLDDENSIL